MSLSNPISLIPGCIIYNNFASRKFTSSNTVINSSCLLFLFLLRLTELTWSVACSNFNIFIFTAPKILDVAFRMNDYCDVSRAF